MHAHTHTNTLLGMALAISRNLCYTVVTGGVLKAHYSELGKTDYGAYLDVRKPPRSG